MNTIPELLNYEYNLMPDSIVIDAGAYDGAWAEAVHKRYGCHIYSYEPVPSFFAKAAQRHVNGTQIKLFNYAVGVMDGPLDIGICANSSGAFATGNNIIAKQAAIIPLLDEIGAVDLFKMNVEGMEYELLETILNHKRIGKIKNLQVQWHWNAPAAKLRWQTIRERLSLTHRCALTTDTDWQIWTRM